MGQGKGYCAMDPAERRLVEYHVVYGVGDYERPFKEKYVRYLVEFSRDEIETFWKNMVLTYRGKVEAET